MELVYMAKRYILEKNYTLLVSREEKEQSDASGEGAEPLFSSLPFENFPELMPLKAYFEMILVRSDGMWFYVLCLKKNDGNSGISPELTLEKLTEIGRNCLKYTGKMNHTKLPVFLEIWEVFNGQFPSGDFSHLKNLRKTAFGSGEEEKVSIRCRAIDFKTGRVWSNYFILTRWLTDLDVKRLIREHNMSDKVLYEEMKKSQIKIIPVIIGVLLSLVCAYTVRYFFAKWGVENGKAYSAVDVCSSLIGIAIAVAVRKFRFNSMWQGLLAGGVYSVALYGGFILMGAEPAFAMLYNTLYVCITGFTFGAMVERM